MKVTRYNNINKYDYRLTDKTNTVKITRSLNGDILFGVDNLNKDTKIEITKENYFIYELIDKLYNDIKDVNIYKIDENILKYCNSVEDEKKLIKLKDTWNESLRSSELYNKISKDNYIKIISDDSYYLDYLESNTVIIKKEEEKYELLIGIHDRNNPFSKCVRIKKKGSTISPFNTIFSEFFENLQGYDPNYEQISMNEYLNKVKVKKK